MLLNINSETYRLNEIDNANLPRKFSEMKYFVYFYESVLKWAVCINVDLRYDIKLPLILCIYKFSYWFVMLQHPLMMQELNKDLRDFRTQTLFFSWIDLY